MADNTVQHFDVMIIGWGKAGKTLAKKAARKGLKVAIIERDPKMYGGTCINVACLPTKSMVHSAKILQQAEHLGVERNWEFNQEAYRKAHEYKEAFTAKLRAKNFGLLDTEETVTVFRGDASFTDEHTVVVRRNALHQEGVDAQGDEQTLISADKIIINTGAVSRELPIPGAKESHFVHVSNGVLDLPELPRRLLIIGAGFIGLEFASYFANFGSQVDVLQYNDQWLPSEDSDDAAVVKEVLTKQGIHIHFNSSVSAFEDLAHGVRATIVSQDGERAEEYDQVLIAVGRVPNVAGLALDNAHVQLGSHGEIQVNDRLQTSTPHIWAVGDVKGGPQFTFISLDDYRIVWPQLVGEEPTHDLQHRRTWATCTFTDPAYARVGLNERQAQEQGIEYTVKRIPVAAVPKAHVINETAGFMKALVSPEGYLLGATLMHYEAAEMINFLTLAIDQKIPVAQLRDMIYTHPTFSEALNDLFA